MIKAGVPWLHLTVLCLLISVGACSSHQTIARQQGFSDQVVTGTPYRHRIFMNQAGQRVRTSPPPTQPAPANWHVYIEGDGRAVTAHGKPSLDPTPRAPLMLSMMAQDPSPALYLGRPCYFHTGDPLCGPVNWTLARYSRETVTSMAASLSQTIPQRDSILLIGHSGGGTLAMLLAQELPSVVAVITLAGNLQVAEWTRHHGYSPLTLSLDPATQPPLPPCIRQFHLAGAEDTEILPEWIRHFSASQPNGHFQLLAGADHRTGWPLWWTLNNLDSTIKSQRCEKVTR